MQYVAADALFSRLMIIAAQGGKQYPETWNEHIKQKGLAMEKISLQTAKTGLCAQFLITEQVEQIPG